MRSVEHVSEEDLESYSLGQLAVKAKAAVERHLLLCDLCRSALANIEPYNFVHYTIDGLVYSRVTALRGGKFFARHWGKRLQGGKEFQSCQGARGYLIRTFAQMFPEHVCSARCGPTGYS